MIRRTVPGLLALLLAATLPGCDTTGTIALVPEFQESFGFEPGLEGWAARSAQLAAGTDVDIARATEGGAAGQGWVRITVTAAEAGGRVWIERPFQVTPEQSYEVTVGYALRTSDGPSTEPWQVVAGAGLDALAPGELTVQGSTTPEAADGVVWDERDHTLVVFSGEADAGEETATVWIALGLGIATAGDRVYGLDEVEVSFLRRN